MAITPYSDVAKDLLHALKFGRARAAADCIARVLHDRVALPPGPWIVTHIPTANSRVRLRGYDQAQLIARGFAAYKCMLYAPLLIRVNHTRQVGASRSVRLHQSENFCRVAPSPLVQNASIIVIDDVITTGATMQSAATVLRTAGAKKVYSLAFASAQ